MSDYFAFDIWWCCLHPYESTASSTLAAIAAGMTGFITVEEYDAMWLAIAGSAALKRAAAYQANYYLVPGVFDPSGEDPIDVYYFDGFFWLAFTVFLISPASACLDGCKVKDFT